jgi:preprotein translocase subunit SecG
MTNHELLRLVAIGAAAWCLISLLLGWGWSRWKRWEREQDELEWRRQERLRWTRS